MSVKDVLQSLVDDGLVDSDRIGTSNYFWAFPSKAINNRKRKMSELESKLAEYESRKSRLDEEVVSASVGREESEERDRLLHTLQEKSQLREKLAAELEKYKACDPDRMKELCKYVCLVPCQHTHTHTHTHTHPHTHTHTHTTLTHTHTHTHSGQESAVAKEAANRWTENVFSIKSWCKNRFSVEESKLDQQFGIPEDFDYL